jgi:hypothetical protein
MNTTLTPKLAAFSAALLCFSTFAAHAEVWGVKSRAQISGPPSTLFHYSESGSGFQAVAPVTLDGTQIDVDGLAMSALGDLYAFALSGAGSRLIAIDKTTAIATAVGPVLPSRMIRGAVISQSGQLLVLDTATNQLLEISLSTGAVIGAGVSLTLSDVPFTLSTGCDIAQHRDGAFIVISERTFYRLDVSSGALTLLYTDTNPGREGFSIFLAGTAFSKDSPRDSTIYIYEVNDEDDLYAYDIQAEFARSLQIPNIISAYNAGRGDLAAQTPEPRVVLSIEVSCVDLCWEAATNRTYQLEYRSSLTTNMWAPFSVPFQGSGSRTCIVDTVRGVPQRFYRVKEL